AHQHAVAEHLPGGVVQRVPLHAQAPDQLVPGGERLVVGVARNQEVQGTDPDLAAVPADVGQVTGQHVQFVGYLVEAAGQVRVVGVLGGDAQGLLLACAADHQ